MTPYHEDENFYSSQAEGLSFLCPPAICLSVTVIRSAKNRKAARSSPMIVTALNTKSLAAILPVSLWQRLAPMRFSTSSSRSIHMTAKNWRNSNAIPSKVQILTSKVQRKVQILYFDPLFDGSKDTENQAQKNIFCLNKISLDDSLILLPKQTKTPDMPIKQLVLDNSLLT
jgi:hypothetical protein